MKKLEKVQLKLKVRRRKKVIKIRMQINKIEDKEKNQQ